jgi:ParB family chromosome partitioning protein
MFEKDTSYKILPLSKIQPDPNQPRKIFDQQDLDALAQSIRELGILSPITVQKDGAQYRLIAGERRWRAAALAGLTEIPCLIRSMDEEKRMLAALVENLQRRDLDPFEEAAGVQELINRTGMTQAEAAKKIGKSQSCVANKLRLLSLSSPVREKLRRAGLTERHARALLTLPENARDSAVNHIISRQMTVEKTEEYIRTLLAPKSRPKRKVYIKDIRLFINTIDHSLRLLVNQGVPAHSNKSEDDQYIYYSISIPKN